MTKKTSPFDTATANGVEIAVGKKAHSRGCCEAKVAFGLFERDEHGSDAPRAHTVGTLANAAIPVPLLGDVAAGVVAGQEAPEGRGLVHGLKAFGGGLAGEAGGALLGATAGGVGGLAAGAAAEAIAKQVFTSTTPRGGGLGGVFGRRGNGSALGSGMYPIIGAGLGGAVGALYGGLKGGYKGVQWGQESARRGDPQHSAEE